MSAEDQLAVRWRVAGLLDENGSSGLQVFNHVAVVDDLVSDVDGPVRFFQSAFDDLDGAINPCAETPRICDKHLHRSVERS